MINKVQPRLMSGILEYRPEEQALLEDIKLKIKNSFETFGYAPIETPTLELAEILLTKGGGETEKEIYRFAKGKNEIALPFDLTVPLARYVAQHRSELTFPFRRYQIQKVWRAERAQRGRYREFYQCDIDIVGTKALVADAEVVGVMYQTLSLIGVPPIVIRMNNRKIYNGLLHAMELSERSVDILRGVDKLHKIGESGVFDELISKGIDRQKTDQILAFANNAGDVESILNILESYGVHDDGYHEGLEELRAISGMVNAFGVPKENVRIDLSTTRGLDYYTGMVYETTIADFPELGSICSGGRYDDLVQYFTDYPLPGVGMSIGLSRLFSRLKDRLVSVRDKPTTAFVIYTDENYTERAISVSNILRTHGLVVQLGCDARKLAKQFRKANQLGVQYTVVIGEEEHTKSFITMKNMKSGVEYKIPMSEIGSFLGNSQK